MSSAPPPTREEIASDATWLIQALDPTAGLARLVRMDSEAYRAASFLDDRMLQQSVEARLAPLGLVTEAAGLSGRDDACWVFHIGHVGSTLIARLLGELPAALSVREPRSLRDLFAAPTIAPPLRRLMARTFSPRQVAIVKATSFVSELAPALIADRGRAAFLFAAPRHYVGSILAGENSVRELHALAPTRMQRMAQRVPRARQPRNDAELAALAWACEMTALEAAAAARPDAIIHWVDFDRWLERCDLAPLTKALGVKAEASDVAALRESPMLGRYSKALEYEYSAGLRAELIAEATALHGRDIDGALALLGALAEDSALLARALDRVKGD